MPFRYRFRKKVFQTLSYVLSGVRIFSIALDHSGTQPQRHYFFIIRQQFLFPFYHFVITFSEDKRSHRCYILVGGWLVLRGSWKKRDRFREIVFACVMMG